MMTFGCCSHGLVGGGRCMPRCRLNVNTEYIQGEEGKERRKGWSAGEEGGRGESMEWW